MTDTIGSLPFGQGRVRKDAKPRLMKREPNPDIHDPNSPEMTAMIKTMLLDQKREERQKRLPELKPPEPEARRAEATDEDVTKFDLSKFVPNLPALRSRRKQTPTQSPREPVGFDVDDEVELLSKDLIMPHPDDVILAEDMTAPAESRKTRTSAIQTLWSTLQPYVTKGYALLRQIKPKHIAFATAAIIILLRPWLVLGLTIALLMVGVITYLSLGHERCVEIAKARWLHLKTRKPEKAEKYFKKAEDLTEQYNATIARLPAKLAERLSLPDLEELAKEDDRPDPFERLAEQSEDD